MKKILVVGQGIAGTAMTWALRQRGAQVHLIDSDAPTSSSRVAAGIINPVTGKRFVKSWGVDTFLPAARSFYRSLEDYLGIAFWHEAPIIRLLNATQEANDWSSRCGMPDYAEWLGERADAGGWMPYLHGGFTFGAIRNSARVDFSQLLPAFRQRMEAEGTFSVQKLSYDQLERQFDFFDAVIFCEGWRAMHNPFFPNLGWQVVKGEAFTIRFKHESDENKPLEMIKKEAIVVPLGDGMYWAGGTYNWTFDDELPTAEEREILINRLNDMFAAPFEIVSHRAAVRPSTKDRRPLLGRSPMHDKVFIFNGLGTKGALLAPFWSQHLAEHILNGAALDPEVSIGRFSG